MQSNNYHLCAIGNGRQYPDLSPTVRSNHNPTINCIWYILWSQQSFTLLPHMLVAWESYVAILLPSLYWPLRMCVSLFLCVCLCVCLYVFLSKYTRINMLFYFENGYVHTYVCRSDIPLLTKVNQEYLSHYTNPIQISHYTSTFKYHTYLISLCAYNNYIGANNSVWLLLHLHVDFHF